MASIFQQMEEIYMDDFIEYQYSEPDSPTAGYFQNKNHYNYLNFGPTTGSFQHRFRFKVHLTHEIHLSFKKSF